MTDTPKRPAGPPRQPQPRPTRPAPQPAEELPGAMKTRAPENIRLARPQMHPIQRRTSNPEDSA